MLTECSGKIEHYEGEITELGIKIESVRETVAKIDREINEGGSLISRLRDNIRMRRLVKDIEATQAEIDSYDMEGAAKAKRTFEDRYQVEKQRETEMQSKVGLLMTPRSRSYRPPDYRGSIVRSHWWRNKLP